MASINAIYQKYTDNAARSATLTIQTGTDPGDTNYNPSSLVDDNPAKVAKILSTTGAWLIDFTVAQRIDFVALIHHDFDAGADVKIQGNASNAWGSPSFSASITIPAWLGSGATRWPVNPWLDLTAAAGYSAGGFRYWRLVITGNSQTLQLGQLWMSAGIRRLTRNYNLGVSDLRQRPMIQNRTAFGVDTIYSRGTSRWAQKIGINTLEDTLRASLRDQWDDAGGRTNPWLYVPNGLNNESYFVRWATPEEQMDRILTNLSTFGAVVEEVSRGLRPGT